MSTKTKNMVYMTMTRVDKGADMHNVSPFLIKRAIDREIGVVEECKKLRSGILLIKCSSEQAEKLSEFKKLNKEVNVKCEQFENISKGKIYSRDFCYLSDDEILSELADQNVSNIKRFKKRDKVTLKLSDEDIGIYVLSFKTSKIPEYLQIGYEKVSVEEYVPDPLRCFKCFRFGHSLEKCNEKIRKCPNCSNDAHNVNEKKCKMEKNCVNCNQNHNSLCRKCEIFIQEKEIQLIRMKDHVSFFEARMKYYKLCEDLETEDNEIQEEEEEEEEMLLLPRIPLMYKPDEVEVEELDGHNRVWRYRETLMNKADILSAFIIMFILILFFYY